MLYNVMEHSFHYHTRNNYARGVVEMISTQTPQKYCREDISLIENYDKAIADKTQLWDCHHRRESIYTKAQLIEMGEYYNRPAMELIFLPPKDHMRVPHIGKTEGWKRAGKTNSGRKHYVSEEGRRRMSENGKIQGRKNGRRHPTEQQKRHLSELLTGRKLTPEQIEKNRLGHIGIRCSEEKKKKISISNTNNPRISKRVLQLNQEGKVLAEFPSASEASRVTGIDSRRICECASGKRACYHETFWAYPQ